MVVLIEKKPTLKIAILATLTLLTITSASAQQWQEPSSDGELYDSTIQLNATAGNAADYQLYAQPPNSDTFNTKNTKTAAASGDTIQFTYEAGSGPYGEYVFTINNTADGSSESITRTVTLDGQGPGITLPVSDDRLNASDVDFEVTAEDQYADVSSLSITVDGPNEEVFSDSADCGSSECSLDVDLSDDLENGNEYTIDVDTEDSLGNTKNADHTFTFDNEYQGDESPEVIPGPQVFATPEGKDEYDFDIVLEEQDPAEPSDITVECKLGGRTAVEADTQSVDGTTKYTCSVEPMRNTQTQLEVIMTDEAGNSVSKEFEYTFDYDRPVVENASTAVSVFNSDFEVDYDAYDSASDVNGMIYQVDDSTLDTDGEVLDSNGSFMVDTSDLGPGSHTLYVWVRDEADRWSESDSLTFDYRPDATPEASVSGLGELRVTAGESKEFSFNVVNTGELMVPSLTLKLDTGFSNHTSIVSDLMPEENRSVSFTVETSESDLGTHEVSLTSENPDISESFQMVVKANSDQQENISESYQARFNEFKDLRANVTELLNKVSGDRKEKLRNDFSELNETMNQAQKAVKEGRYYEADSLLEGIDSRFSEARQGYKEVREDHQIAQRNKFIFGFLLFAVVIGGGAVGYFYRHDDYEFDFSAIEDLEFGRIGDVSLGSYSLSMEPVENFIERIKEFLEEEEEKAEDAFQGFTN